MNILAIDTSGNWCSTALSGTLSDGAVVESVKSEDIGRGHAEKLLPMIQTMFDEAGLTYDWLDRIVVVTGPGTYTGLRVGLSVARAFALALGVPCVGVTSLEAFAAQADCRTGDIVHVVIAGRGGQGFYQAFMCDVPGKALSAVARARNEDFTVISKWIGHAPACVTGNGLSAIGLEQRDDHIDPLRLAHYGEKLSAAQYPPEPTYMRDADAVKARTQLQTAKPQMDNVEK